MNAHVALALAALAIAPGVRGESVQLFFQTWPDKCTNGTAIAFPAQGGLCPTVITGLWTPSQCTDKGGSNNTKDLVDKAVGSDHSSPTTRTCREWYQSWGCQGPQGQDLVKPPFAQTKPGSMATADCNWKCAFDARWLTTFLGCNNQTDCTQTSKVSPLYHKMACSSFQAMHTDMCDVTAADITNIVSKLRTDKRCVDDGPTFFAVPGAAVVTTPAPVATAPTETKHFVTLIVTLPYTKADFESKQDKYKAAIAAAAGTSAANVEILVITEKRRRAGSVDVQTKVGNAPLFHVILHNVRRNSNFLWVV